METKNCHMLVTKNYSEALEKCKIDPNAKVDIPDDELTIANDVARSTLISLKKTFADLRKIWLEDYRQSADNKYDQANIEGSNIPSLKMKQIKNAIMQDLWINVQINQLGFTYFDDNDNLCGFTLTLLPQCTTLWFVAVTVHTNAPDNQRQVTVFTPQFSRSLFDNSQELSNLEFDLESKISENMNLDSALLIPMDNLSEYLGCALNSQFVRYFISPLFDKQGGIQLEEFQNLSEAIKQGLFALRYEISRSMPITLC